MFVLFIVGFLCNLVNAVLAAYSGQFGMFALWSMCTLACGLAARVEYTQKRMK